MHPPRRLHLLAACWGFLIVASAVWSAGPIHHPPACEPGYTLVEETIWCDVVKKVCRTVPDVKKTSKWVYVVEHEDFCTQRCKLRGGCTDCSGEPACPTCSRPRTRGNLVKKLVQESHPTTKCGVEEVVERVPFKVYRKVPCPARGPLPSDHPPAR